MCVVSISDVKVVEPGPSCYPASVEGSTLQRKSVRKNKKRCITQVLGLAGSRVLSAIASTRSL